MVQRAKHRSIPDPAAEEPNDADAPGGSSTVTVACKYPLGFQLRLHALKTNNIPKGGGGYEQEKRWVPVGEIVEIRGYKGLYFDDASHPRYPVIGGYALTPGVNRQFWDQWLEQNKDNPIVKSKLIFAHHEKSSVDSFCRDNKDVLCGLEPIHPDTPPKSLNQRHLTVGPDDGQ
jgi:hypothetical protein